MRVLLLCTLAALVPMAAVEGGKVLLLPMIGASHTINFAQIGGALIKRGHQVTAYVNGDCGAIKRLSKAGIELLTYNNTVAGCVMESEEITSGATKAMDSGGFNIFKIYEVLSARFPLIKTEVVAALSDQSAIRKMKNMDFDLIIVDGLEFNKHVYVITHILKKPVVSLMAVFNPFEAGIPALPSVYPMQMAGNTEMQTFTDRLKNVAVHFVFKYIMPFVLPNSDSSLVTKYAPDTPYKSLSEIASQTKLWLVMSDEVIDYARPTVPSVINIGGLNTKPAVELPDDMKSLADNAKDGLIILSFGSQFVLSPRLLRIFFATFKDLPQQVIMRHTETSVEGVPSNVRITKWMPQNDLLAHPNTKLFITHCGANGQFEGLYHGVPMLGIPIVGEQSYNCRRAEYHEVGLTLDIKTITSVLLADGIKKITTSPSFYEKIHRMSAAFRDRPQTPMERAVYWVEHVLKYGGDELRPMSADLPFYQFFCVDIALFVTVVLVVVTFIICKLLTCFCALCCRQRVSHSHSFNKKTQ